MASVTGSFNYTPDPGFTGTDQFVYRMRDASFNSSDSITDTLAVLDPDNPEPPTAAAAQNELPIIAGETVTLDGSGSSDPDGNPLTYDWTLNGPAADPVYTGASLSGVSPTFCAAEAGVYTASPIVNDGAIDSEPDEVEVTAITVDDALSSLVAEVEALGEDGVLNRGQVRALTGKLEHAADLLDDGKTAEALAVLVDYEQQLADLVDGGVLTAEQAEALSAEVVIAVVASPRTVGSAGAGALASLAGDASAPDRYELSSIYPNSFSGSATIIYDVPEAAYVRVIIYDVLGREVAVLADGAFEAARHEVVFDGGSRPSGTYLVRLTTDGGFVQTQRVTLMR